MAEEMRPLAERRFSENKLFKTTMRQKDKTKPNLLIMKKIILTLVAALSMTAAMAQNEQSGNKERKAPKEMTYEERTEQMKSKLGLSDAQAKKVKELNKEYQDVFKGPGMGGRGGRPGKNASADNSSAKKERPQMSSDNKANMEKGMAKRKEYDAKLKEILSDDQYQSYQKMQPQRGGKGGRGGHGKKSDKAEE